MENNPLVIAHIDTEQTWRGGEQQVLDLVRGLKQKGHRNLAVVKRGGALASKIQMHCAKVLELKPLGEWDLVAAYRLRRFLLREKVDVVHAHSGHGVALAALATVRTSLPFILTRRVDFSLSTNSFSKWKYRRAQRVIAISQKVRTVLIDCGIPPKKISLVPSGINFEKFIQVKKVSKLSFGCSEDSIVIGQVAALAAHKDQGTFIRAIHLLHGVNPRVVGVILGDGELRKDLQAFAEYLGLSSSFKFLGFKDNYLDYLAAFDLFCLSSKEEGLGTAILDAMALRIPVVATNVGGIPDMIEQGKTGYLSPPQNPEALVEVLEGALQKKNRDALLLDAAYQKARTFDISHTISRTEDIYKSLSCPDSYPHN